jgi:hypothetical protein
MKTLRGDMVTGVASMIGRFGRTCDPACAFAPLRTRSMRWDSSLMIGPADAIL